MLKSLVKKFLLMTAAFAIISSSAYSLSLKDIPVSEGLADILKYIAALPVEKRIDSSTPLLETYVHDNPGDVLGHYYLARSLFDSLDFDGAMAEAGEALARMPDFADAHALSARVLLAKHDLSLTANATGTLLIAKTAVLKALELDPQRYDFYMISANVNSSLGMPEAAAIDCEHAIDLNPAEPNTRILYADMLTMARRPNAALMNIKIALILCNNNNERCIMPREDLIDSVYGIQSAAERAIETANDIIRNGDGSVNKLKSAAAICGDCPGVLMAVDIPAAARANGDMKLALLRKAAAAAPMDINIRKTLCAGLLAESEERQEISSEANDCLAAAGVLPLLSNVYDDMWYGADDVNDLTQSARFMRIAGMKREAAGIITAAGLLAPDDAGVKYEAECLFGVKCPDEAPPLPSER